MNLQMFMDRYAVIRTCGTKECFTRVWIWAMDPGLIRGTDRLWVWGMDRDLTFTQIDMMCVTIASKNCSTPIV